MVAAERFLHCVGAANLVWRVLILEHAFGAAVHSLEAYMIALRHR